MKSKTSNSQTLADILSDGGWHLNRDLAASEVGHRFGASILILRKGELDGRHWEIEVKKGDARGDVWYRWTGRFLASYETFRGRCLDCGSTNIDLHDARLELEKGGAKFGPVLNCPANAKCGTNCFLCS